VSVEATTDTPVLQAGAPQTAVEGGLRTFAVVAGGQFVSIMGSALTAFAMGIWVYQQTGSVTSLSLIILAASLPGILVSPLAGSFVDRSDRRRVMLVSAGAACLAELATAGLILSGRASLASFFVLAAVISLADAFQEPAYMASVPLLVPKRYLGQASGFVQFSQGIARIVTPALAGVMLETVGIGVVLLADMATFLVAATTLLCVRIPRPAPWAEGDPQQKSLWREAAIGWNYLRDRSGLMALLLLFAMVNFLVALVNVLYIPLVLSFSSARVLGVTFTIGGTGMLAGSIAVMALGVPRRKIRAIMGLICLGSLAIGALGVRPWAALIAGSGFAMMFVLPLLQATSQVLWQTKVALAVQGRVLALRKMLAQASLPAAYLLAGPLADAVFEPLLREGGPLASSVGLLIGVGPGRGIGLTFVTIGFLGCFLAALGYAYPRTRRLEQELPDMIADTTT